MTRLSILLFLMLCCSDLFAAPPEQAKIAAAFQESFPKLAVDQVTETPVAGLYEILCGDRIFYYAPASGHLLVGPLVSREGENVTAVRIQEVMAQRIKGISLKEALTIGNGPHQVVEVTDPDCGYCRKGARFFDERSDVTRHIFLKPLGMHPQSRDKAAYILSASDPKAAYLEVFAGKFDDKPLPSFQDNGRLDRQANAIAPLKVASTPSYWIDGTYVGGSDLRRIQQLLAPPQPELKPAPSAPAPQK
ncbi:MAG: DsbC family protein [Deltaproteobacteria bacterium]|nr:DsbC family protein [Deltaproteobacteria bacterium]